nr:hypothetical protein [Corynebacterium cyclohexanicum]
MVDGVRDDGLVARLPRDRGRQDGDALGLVELRDLGLAVEEALRAGADHALHGLEVGAQLDEAVVAGVDHEIVAVLERDGLAGEAQGAGRGLRGHIRAVAAVQRALRLVLGDELLDQHAEPAGVPLPREVGHDVALGVDDHERRPRAGRVRLPREEVGIVEDRVVDVVALDGGRERHRVGLVLELGRVHPDRDEDVLVLLLERAQLVQDVEAVDAAEGPEIKEDDLPAQRRQIQLRAAGVEPRAAAELARADTVRGAHRISAHRIGAR